MLWKMVCGNIKYIFLVVNGLKHAKPCFIPLMCCEELLRMCEMLNHADLSLLIAHQDSLVTENV